jgi:sulfite reductase (NADPH) flavoprotein alpha-component
VTAVRGGPLTAEQAELVGRLLPTLTAEQRAWLSGFLAGWNAAAAPAEAAGPEVTVLYGSQTGNAQALAERLAERVRALGRPVRLAAMADYEPRQLARAGCVLLVVSTHGDGEPPDNARAFHEFLHSRRAQRLDGLRYAVLALGDSSYPRFCQTGRDLDRRLRELGATPIQTRADCDLDYAATAAAWMDGVVAALAAEGPTPAAPAPAAPAAQGYGRERPFPAEVLDSVELHGRGAAKSTRHLELSLAGSGLRYEPGDALGVYPENSPELVEELLLAMDWDPDAPLPDGTPLRQALIGRYEITTLTRPLLARLAEVAGHRALRELLAPEREAELRAYVAGRDLLDVVRDFGLRGLPAREVVAGLRRLPPRLYSLASSPRACPDEAHVAVRVVRYAAHGRSRQGVASAWLAARRPGETVPVFVQRNPNFRLPADPDLPVVMIGPGTGVAPFRAFLQEREAVGARGRTWLFFGEWHFRTDFLYQAEWLRWRERGVLTRMDVAFSRDGDRKVYVQHRLLAHGRDIYAWLQEGAHVYVCGDAQAMAADVHAALAGIVGREGGLDPEAAAAYLDELQRARRYQRDVY